MIIEGLLGRGCSSVVDLKIQDGFEDSFQQLIADGIPILYANHQSHADALPVIVVSEYLRKLAARIPNGYPLKGFVIPIATSMVSGDQSAELTRSFELFKETAKTKGLEGIPITREKDTIQYGMSRANILKETRPFVEKLRQGFGIALFPEGSVQGGRHPQRASIEKIYGMQEVTNDSLISFYELARRIVSHSGRRPFFIPLGLHGSFRFLQCPEGGKPRPTPQGWIALLKGIIGLPDIKIQTNLGMPITEDQLLADLGPKWIEDIKGLNRHLMEKITPMVPVVARGIYEQSLQSV